MSVPRYIQISFVLLASQITRKAVTGEVIFSGNDFSLFTSSIFVVVNQQTAAAADRLGNTFSSATAEH